MDDERLSRIERKLDEVGEAIVALARMEERMISLFRRMDHYDGEQRDITKRIGAIERSVGTNGQAVRFAERLFWIATSSALTLLITRLGGWV